LVVLLTAMEWGRQLAMPSLPKPRFLTKSSRVRNIRAVLVFGQLLRQLVQYRGRKIWIVTKGISQLFERIQRLRCAACKRRNALATNSVVASFCCCRYLQVWALLACR
jgi:hypothetical protein